MAKVVRCWDVDQGWLLLPSRTMAARLMQAGRRSRYRLRNQVVEPVFGQIKEARGYQQFLLRSLDQVRGEWAMICTTHNLLSLAKAGH